MFLLYFEPSREGPATTRAIPEPTHVAVVPPTAKAGRKSALCGWERDTSLGKSQVTLG